MALPTEPTYQNRHQTNQIPNILHSATSNLQSIFNFNSIIKPTPSCSARVCFPLMYPDSPKPLAFESIQPDSGPKTDARNISSPTESNKGFPSTVRIGRVNSNSNGGGPAFVGQVFSMCDLSGTGLMAVSTHFDIPFISKRTPEWLKKMFATITKSERNGPVFRFFMDLGDAVAYVKRLNIPSGVVGACRLDLAYEHFKEKPHLFQFVPNEKQVKAANKLLKTIPQESGCKKVDGVPVFSAQNLDIAISTTDGIKWYTPYFFDKNMLDNILEESVDQHFHELIQTRHLQRRREVVDDNMAAEVMEEIGDSLWEPPEVQEMMDEMGHPGIPLSVVSKAAEMQLLYAVDKVLLGNRWLRKATGIQPNFPYIVDSFEKRSAASFQRIYESTTCLPNSETGHDTRDILYHDASEPKPEDDCQTIEENGLDFRLPFRNWFSHQFSKQKHNNKSAPKGFTNKNKQQSLMPKVTMVGISTGEGGQMSKASLKKTMEDLTRELEQIDHEDATRSSNGYDEFRPEKDPLFVANVADYHSGMSKRGSARLVRSESN